MSRAVRIPFMASMAQILLGEYCCVNLAYMEIQLLLQPLESDEGRDTSSDQASVALSEQPDLRVVALVEFGGFEVELI